MAAVCSVLSFNFPAITCSLLGTLANGIITYDPDTTPPFNFETSATYSCNTGYGLSLSGTSYRSCLGSPIGGGGQWTGRDSATCDCKNCVFFITHWSNSFSSSTVESLSVHVTIIFTFCLIHTVRRDTFLSFRLHSSSLLSSHVHERYP